MDERTDRVAIVGAGMAGLACAESLAAAGIPVVLFDKGRGPGGRMSTRRIDTPLGPASFDFGTQYFTARDPGFAAQVARWEQSGVVTRWPAARDDAWIGTPSMNAVIRDLAGRHEVHFQHLVKGLLRDGESWSLLGDTPDDRTGETFAASRFARVVLALPAEQTAPILTLHDFALSQTALFARSQPCWTGMFVFSEPVPHQADVLRDVGMIAWAARDNAKPGRGGPESWVVQATPAWSVDHLEQAPETIAAPLLAALGEAVGAALPQPVAQSIHRWRYGLSAGTGCGCLWNPTLGLGVCGDWLLGPRVECAWVSGAMLAKRMIAAARPSSKASAAAPEPVLRHPA